MNRRKLMSALGIGAAAFTLVQLASCRAETTKKPNIIIVLADDMGYVNDKSLTIAQALKQNGYQTFMGGKWHLGHKERSMWPDQRGFDQFYGTPAGGGIYFYPSKFYDRPVFWNGEQVHPDSTWYSTDAFTDYSIDYNKRYPQGQVLDPFFPRTKSGAGRVRLGQAPG